MSAVSDADEPCRFQEILRRRDNEPWTEPVHGLAHGPSVGEGPVGGGHGAFAEGVFRKLFHTAELCAKEPQKPRGSFLVKTRH
jgi:hypothetical protein